MTTKLIYRPRLLLLLLLYRLLTHMWIVLLCLDVKVVWSLWVGFSMALGVLVQARWFSASIMSVMK